MIFLNRQYDGYRRGQDQSIKLSFSLEHFS
jgi:hypothetical protein